MVLLDPFVATSRGSDALFYPLIFLHVVSALAGFGSIGLAGTYASRAAQLAEAGGGYEAGRAGEGGDDAVDAGERAGGEPGDDADEADEAGERAGGEAGEAGEGGESAPSQGGLDPEGEELVRYFQRPARFWKAVLVVPVFGVLALLVQPGRRGLDQVWDLAALLVWGCAALLASGIVVPSLRQMSSVLLGPGARWQDVPAQRARVVRYGHLASRGAAACDVLFFVALALMIWQP